MSLKHFTTGERLDALRVMLEGIALHQEEMAAIGISDAMVQEVTDQKALVESADVKQEQLKAKLKVATDQVQAEMKTLWRQYSKLRKILKAFYPQKFWLTFGIGAKR